MRQPLGAGRNGNWWCMFRRTAILLLIVGVLLPLGGMAVRLTPPSEPHDPGITVPVGRTFPSSAATGEAALAMECPVRCLVRVPADAPLPVLWRHDAIAYAVLDAGALANLRAGGRESIVVQASDETLAVYGMFGVQPDNDALISAVGTVLDHQGDVRLIAAQKLPLHVGALYAAGIHVEKVTPVCPQNAGLPAFSLTATLNEIVGIGTSDRLPLGDRQYDGPGTTMGAAYLYCRFSALGFVVHYDDFADDGGRHQLNVVAQAPNQSLDANTTLITGHYDTRSPAGDSAPGADDNASGIAVMLDLASRDAGSGFAFPLGFVAFAAEEPGLLGSTAYTRTLERNGVQLRAVINVDAIGIPNNSRFYINGNGASRALYLQLVAASTDDQTLLWMTNPNFLSDDEQFRRHGYVAVMVTTHPYGTEPLHHTDRDLIENLDFAQITAVADLVWRWLAAALP